MNPIDVLYIGLILLTALTCLASLLGIVAEQKSSLKGERKK